MSNTKSVQKAKHTVTHLGHTPNPLVAIEVAGRVCYKSEDKITPESAKAFVTGLIKRGHESVLEHVSFSFRCITDRGVTHELVRHRIGVAFSQESTRYCNYGKDKFGGGITVIDNPRIDAKAQRRRDTLWRAIEKVYLAELKEGIAPQDARDVLPNALKTEIVVTANLREWRHILRLRTSPAAHPSIRFLMSHIFAWFMQNLPEATHDLVMDIPSAWYGKEPGHIEWPLIMDDPLMVKET
jgi:thymidylate synthase (FAD)